MFNLLLIIVYVYGFAWFTPRLSAQSVLYAGVPSMVNSGLGSPAGLAVDGNGNIYTSYPFFDGGAVVQVPWTAASGYGAPMNVATGLGSPFGLAVDGSGNVYIAVSNTGSVVEASPAGGGSWNITTPISGLSSPKGVAVDGQGNLYVADAGSHAVIKEPWTGSGYGVPSTLANVATSGNTNFTPYGVTVDASGNVFVADFGNGAGTGSIVEIPSGCTVAAGNCPMQLDSGMHEPEGIAVDGSENLFIADYDFGWVLELPWTGSGYSSTHPPLFNQGMLAVNSRYYPTGVAVDRIGNVYYSDTANNRVEKGNVDAVDFGTVGVGSSSATISVSFVFVANATLGGWKVLTHGDGATGLDFSDALSGTCSSTGPSNSYLTNDGCTVDVSFTPKSAGLRSGAVTLTDTSGNVLATAYLHGIGEAPQAVFSPGTQSSVVSGLNSPAGLAVDGSGNVYIASSSSNNVSKYSNGSQSAVGSGLSSSSGVAVDGGGNVFVADTGNHQVVEVPWTGSSYGTQTTVVSGLNSPKSVAVDGAGNLYIADSGTKNVVKLSWIVSGYDAQLTLANTTTNPGIDPVGVAVDSSGNVYIADTGANHQVVEVSWTGSGYGSQAVVDSGLSSPVSVAVDGGGNVYIADSGTRDVVKVPWTGSSYGTQSLLADATTSGSSFNPTGVAVDVSGNVYIADSGNSQVVEVDVADPPSLTFASTPASATSSDSPETVVVSNIGNKPLILSSPGNNPLYPTNFSENLSDRNLCAAGSTLGAGVSCDVSASFVPPTAGSFSGQIELVDNVLNGGGTQNINVSGTGTLALSPGSLLAGTVGIAYSESLTATGGSGSYTYSVTGGALPAGLILSSLGVLSGTPTAGGSFSITITATDSNNHSFTAVQPYSLAIGAATITLSPASVPGATYGSSYNQTLTASGGTSTYSFSVTTGSLPSGLTLSTSGVSSGTLTAAGPFTFTVTATDSSTGTGPYSGSHLYSLTVAQATPTLVLTCTEVSYDGDTHSCVGTATGVGGATVSGTWSYTPASATSAGSTPVTGTFTSSNANYTNGTANGTLKIDAATPTLALTCAEVIYDGNTHSCVGTATGVGGATVSGSWSYTPASATAVGSTPISGTFTSSNTNYTGGTANGTLKIDAATPTLALTCTEVTYDGNTHSCAGTATGVGGATVSGTWTYSPASATSAGSTPVTGTFTSSNTNYTSGTANGTLKIDAAMPTITWATPAAVFYGTVLSSTQLNAMASVPGTFVYNLAAGTTPPVGNDTLSVTFTPTDATDYKTATASVVLVVNPLNPMPTISSISPAFSSAGGAIFTLTVNGSGFIGSSTIYWGTSALATQYVSATRLTAQVTATDIATAGITAVSVQTPTPGGGTSNTLQFEVDSVGSGTTAPAIGSPAATIAAGSMASYMVTFPSTVTNVSVTCLNLPIGATCSYSSSTDTVTVATSSTTPPGTYQVILVFTETVSGTATASILLPILLLPLVFLRRKLALRGIWVNACVWLVLTGALAFSTACGGGSGSSAPPQTHQVTSSGVVSLTVQ
jgi:sugar lactone lactonase YvrE